MLYEVITGKFRARQDGKGLAKRVVKHGGFAVNDVCYYMTVADLWDKPEVIKLEGQYESWNEKGCNDDDILYLLVFGNANRITSYNVCYTKLLRWKKRQQALLFAYSRS